MGRKPTKNLNLPTRMRARRQKSGKVYFYYDSGGTPRRELPLGDNYVEAIRRWAELEYSPTPIAKIITFRNVAERYLREIIPTKAERTQKDNLTQLAMLYQFFDNPPCPLSEIEPLHIRQYLDWRNKHAIQVAQSKNLERKAGGKQPIKVDNTLGQIAANREKALFSHIWNKAREWGYTDRQNPCQGVSGHKEKGRDVYVDEPAYMAVWQQADQPLRDAMDMALLTGQRPADLLKMTESDLRDGALWLQQNKTGIKLRIAIVGELAALIDRILKRKHAFAVRSLKLLVDNDGTPLEMSTIRSKFERARSRSGQTWQFRDLRAKAATEKEMVSGIAAAQDQLGHTTSTMTAAYVRNRAGKLVKPTR
ncbi:tyrosine-type recombinase/integrase [Chitinimonas sp. PSY-7]|uniref:tyrosine-type recombinase/integrase n=1 Tax=Chitinimonas sp. PSY-7 TaxID=3459088 RepID=UPI0040403D92